MKVYEKDGEWYCETEERVFVLRLGSDEHGSAPLWVQNNWKVDKSEHRDTETSYKCPVHSACRDTFVGKGKESEMRFCSACGCGVADLVEGKWVKRGF